MEDALARHRKRQINTYRSGVLILVVMEDALAHFLLKKAFIKAESLNPCCNGRCTRTIGSM